MGMEIEKAILQLEECKAYKQCDTEKDLHAFDIAIDTMRKYQMFQTNYVKRLKADMVAMLTEIQLEIEELKSYESADGQDLVMLADIGILFQQKINALKAESEKKDAGN